MDNIPTDLLLGHPLEQKMGMMYYASKEAGFQGILRTHPRDFKVEEILPDGRIVKFSDEQFSFGEDEPGLFTEFVLIKRNIESHAALLKIVRALKRDLEDINIAGTKDKTAHTAQRATIWRVPAQELLKLQIKNITIRSPRTTIYKTYLGDLKGNHFTIKIRNLNKNETEVKKNIDKIRDEIKKFNGIPNYFGHQRFGARRPISHIIGKHILKEEYEEAICTYLSFESEYELDSTNKARKLFQETNDPEIVLRSLPKIMVFERLILSHLAKNPSDFFGAYRKLPKNMQRLFIHSHQSYIWNRALSERIRLFGTLEKQDIDLIEDNSQIMEIIGFNTKLSDNILSDFILNLFEEDGISQSKYKMDKISNLKFTGHKRRMVSKTSDFSYKISKDKNNNSNVEFSFSLLSGSYATVVLREFMKTSPLAY
jgi:tRNA pseudouridine13 synthase